MRQTVPIPSFENFPVHCGTTTRRFPLRVGSTKELAEDRTFFTLGQKLLGIKSAAWAVAEQPHGDTVTLLDREPSFAVTLKRGTDGLITQNPNQVLSILTADCLPIFLYLEEPLTIGLVHAGWRGTAKGIVRNAVSVFKRLSKGRTQTIHAAFGPSIHGCCYEVGEEFRGLFPESLLVRNGHLYLDLAEENRRQLLEAGLLPDRIGSKGPCCGCHLDSFYSYRKEGDLAYRMLSWIALKAVGMIN